MTDRPMIFSAPMIRALLDGTKTQTRRLVKPWAKGAVVENLALHGVQRDQREYSGRFNDPESWGFAGAEEGNDCPLAWWPEFCPQAVGDRIWVRETFTLTQFQKPVYRADARDQTGARWHSIAPGDPGREVKWRSPIHMLRWASRITLVVTDVRPERVQDINEEDARAEGFSATEHAGVDRSFGEAMAIAWFRKTWNNIHGPDAWDRNDWVWRIAFDVHACNIDSLPLEAKA